MAEEADNRSSGENGSSRAYDRELALQFSEDIQDLTEEYHEQDIPRGVLGLLLSFEEDRQKGKAEGDELTGPLADVSTKLFRTAEDAKREYDIPDMQMYAELRELANCFRHIQRERASENTGEHNGE